jgi:hypothetical protein
MSLIRINKDPTRGQLAIFGGAWLVFVGLWGWAALRHGHPSGARVLWAVALAAPVAGLLWAPALRALYLGLSYATYPIGLVVSHVVLALVYYLALAPIGLTMRLFRNDPLTRRFDRDAKTYWRTREAARPAKDYFNQS